MADEVPLREYLEQRDDDLSRRFDRFESANAEDHSAVIRRLESLEGEMKALGKQLGGVVTWRSLGFGVGLAAGVYTLLEKLT